MREGVSSNKERLTVQWLSQSITELRSEVAELQDSSSSLSRSIQQKSLSREDIQDLRDENKRFKLELDALRSRQDQSEVLLKELREEAIQSAADLRKSLLQQQKVRYSKA